MKHGPEVEKAVQTLNSMLGEGEFETFYEWAGKQMPRYHVPAGIEVLALFVRWLVETGDGDVALKRINAVPRQMWLDFGDTGKWVVEEGEEG